MIPRRPLVLVAEDVRAPASVQDTDVVAEDEVPNEAGAAGACSAGPVTNKHCQPRDLVIAHTSTEDERCSPATSAPAAIGF
jgi:hypothetical protein